MSFHLTDNYKRGSSRQGYSENDLINSRLVIGEGFFAAIYFWSGVDASVFLSVFFTIGHCLDWFIFLAYCSLYTETHHLGEIRTTAVVQLWSNGV